MKPRFVIIVVAVILGVVATLGVNGYLAGIKKQAVEEQKTVKVWVAASDIPKGTSIEDIQEEKFAELKNIPQRYVASQAMSSIRNIEGQVLSVDISVGEQLTVGKFKHPSEAGLSFSVPKDFIAVSIPYDEIKGVAGMVKPGDLLTVFSTFNPGPDGEDATKILLQKVQVIAVGATVGAEKTREKERTVGAAEASPSETQDQKTVTLALKPAEAEKVVFAQENGKIWLGLHPTNFAEAATTKGITLKTVYK